MEIEDSTLWREISAVLQDGSKPVSFGWTAQLHADPEDFEIMKVLGIDFIEDHENNFTETVIIELLLGGGTFLKRVYPNRERLEVTLIRNPMNETGEGMDFSQAAFSERYSATLLDTSNALLEGNIAGTASEQVLNQANIIPVKLQLINKSIEQLRMVSVGGSVRNATVKDTLLSMITATLPKVKVEKALSITGVDLIDPSNSRVYPQIVIPHGTLLSELPDMVHQNQGIYNSGLGSFIHQGYWYIYPKYDVTRFNSTSRSVTIIRVPPNKLPSIERTYRIQGDNVVILATSDSTFQDDSERLQLNQGNGVRFSDSSKFMGGFVETADNKSLARRGATNNEFIANQRLTGNNNVQLSRTPISANPYLEYSKLAQRQGSLFTLVWENSNMDLLLPGTQIQILYLEGEEIKQLQGTLHALQHAVQLAGQGLTANRYQTRTAIGVFVTRSV